MAKKLPGLQRVIATPSLAAVAYGEIASSLFFALGIVALDALGLTPWVLLAVGSLFVLVALSYAEGTAALPETGGAATFVRRAFNDQLGFLTGWAIFLDYVIVIALAALFVPHYLGNAVGWNALTTSPTDLFVGVGVICVMAAVRFVRRPSLYRLAIVIAGITFVGLLLLIVLGMPLLFSVDNLSKGTDLGTAPTWGSIAFAIPVAMLAYTGLETVANLAAETREPGRTLPRSLFVGIGAAVVVSFLIALVALSAYPADPETQLGTRWLRAPLVGVADAFSGHLPDGVVDVLRVFIGLTGVVILVAVITTSFSGAGRLAYSLGPARHAPARVRAPEPQDADLAGDDHLDGRDLGRDPPGRQGGERPGAVPREPVQLRRPDRVHRGAGRRRAAPLHGTGSRTPVPRAGQRAHPRHRGARRGADRRAAHLRDLDLRLPHARCCADRRARSGSPSARSSSSAPGSARGSASSDASRRRSATSSRTSRARTSASSSR